jgi:hypothetical protein
MTRERYADEPDPGPLLVCNRPPCEGRLYHDQAMHDFLAHRYNVPINLDHPLAALAEGRIDQAEYRRRMGDLERRAADSLDVEPAPRRPPEPRPLHHHTVDDGASDPIWHRHAMPNGDVGPYRHPLRYAQAHRPRSADDFDRRRPEPDRSGMVIVWMAVLFALCLLAIAIAGIVAHLAAAPRTTHQPTVELGPSEGTTAGAGDTPLTVNLGASAVGSSGAPLEREAWLGVTRAKTSAPARHDGGAP